MISVELSPTVPENDQSVKVEISTGLDMKEGINRLISSFEKTLLAIRKELNRQLVSLLVPLILFELAIYIAIIVVINVFYVQQLKNGFLSVTAEIFIIIPIIFIYCDWNLCKELYDNKQNLGRFEAILERLKKIDTADEAWDDLLVEFEEGEVQYVFLYRNNHWQRWPTLLVVKDDIICFPSVHEQIETKYLKFYAYDEVKSSASAGALFSSDQIISTNDLGQICVVSETPISAFLYNAFSIPMDSTSNDHFRPYFWNRLNRWLHGDLSIHDGSSFCNRKKETDEEYDKMNSKILNYSVYHGLYRNIYSFCTCVTWILVLINLIIHIPSLEFLDLRLVLVTFFVCPLTVAVLESIYEWGYIFYTVGFWKYIQMTGEHILPSFKEIRRSFRIYYNNPLDLYYFLSIFITSIHTIPLLSLPYCTNFNILSKKVVCRDYPFISSLYCVTKEQPSKPIYKSAISIVPFDKPDHSKKHKPLHIKQLSIYNSHGHCAFYDKNWKEKLNMIKPTGLLTLLMSRSNKCRIFHKNSIPDEDIDIQVKLSRFIMQLTNNYYKESFYEIADVIGFFHDDLPSQSIHGKINILRESISSRTRAQSISSSTSSVSSYTRSQTMLEREMSNVILRYKLGGRHFGEVYMFTLKRIENSIDILFFGDIKTLLPYLTCIWTGHHLKPMTEEFRQEILQVELKNKQQFIPVFLCGHNFIPLSDLKDLPETLVEELNILETGNLFISVKDGKYSEIASYLLKDSNFLSLLTVDDAIKPDLPDTIDKMSQLGVRYIYYSPFSYHHSWKLASRMGLETGWNTAISLADECDEERLPWEAFAQLPHGVDKIIEHLITQDNIPLLVHLFTHSTHASIVQLLQVMTQWGEGVISVTNSSYNHLHEIVNKSRFIITMNQFDTFHFNSEYDLISGDIINEEHPPTETEKVASVKLQINKEQNHFFLTTNSNKKIFHLNELLLSHDATLHIDNRTNLSVLPSFINECKRFANNMDNMLIIGVSLIYCMNLCLLFDWFLDIPPMLETASLYTLLLLVIPLFSLFMFTSEATLTDTGMFALLPWKPLNLGDKLHIPSIFVIRIVSRFIIMTVLLIILDIVCWLNALHQFTSLTKLTPLSFLNNSDLKLWLQSHSEQKSYLQYIIDLFLMLILEFLCYINCILLMNRDCSFIENIKQQSSKYLTICFIFIFLLSYGIGELVCYTSFKSTMIANIPWWAWISVLGASVIMIIIDTIWMKKESNLTKEENQIYRWNFDTRLGMWSPT